MGKKEPVISDARKRQREQEALEKQIEALENIVHEYEEGFAHILPTDFAVLEAHTKQYETYKADLQGLYQQWESLVG